MSERAAGGGGGVDAEALARIEAAVARIELRVERVEAHARAAVGTATDAADRWVDEARGRGVDVDERARAAMRLAERVTDPRVVAALERALDLATRAPDLAATAMDAVDGILARMHDAGIDADDRGRRLLRALERLTSPEALDLLGLLLSRLDAIHGVLDGGVLDPRATQVVGTAGRALAATSTEHPPPLGPLAALRAMSDSDVRTAVGFALRFAKNFGRALGARHPALPAQG